MKLVYFAINTGRARAINLTAHLGQVPLSHELLKMDPTTLVERAKQTPYNAFPLLVLDDGTQVAQSNAILSYIGKLAGLYPDSPTLALYCDEVLAACEEFMHHLHGTLYLTDTEQAIVRQALCEREFPNLLKGLGQALKRTGRYYVTGEQLSVADLRLYTLVDSLQQTGIEHISKTLVAEHAPLLCDLHQRIDQLPAVKAFNQRHPT